MAFCTVKGKIPRFVRKLVKLFYGFLFAGFRYLKTDRVESPPQSGARRLLGPGMHDRSAMGGAIGLLAEWAGYGA